jgi:uncharacterized Zn-binding protein involved in type VI secretion
MAGVARFGDICTGHDCYPPRQNIAGSSNVFVNSRGAHRQLDGWGPHCWWCCCSGNCHLAISVKGSSMVFVNSRQLMRLGDPISCGSAVGWGSKNVGCGG